MPQIEIKRQLAGGDVEAVSGLLELAAAHDGHRRLGDHEWLDLVRRGDPGFAGLVAWESRRPVGYAQLTRRAHGWALELVVAPVERHGGEGVALDLLRAALATVADEGGGDVHLWVPSPTPTDDAAAEAAGLRSARDLLQLRRPLPVAEPWELEVRPFVAGQDEEAWLDVNNRAFDWHPEQGGWDLAALRAREAEAWFDPNGFLLHERDGKLAGFCWTKIHRDEEPPLGEIYVIAVDPRFAGQGLGHQLVLAGLDHLAGRGVGVAMLYVDASNGPARRLYQDLGFSVDHVDRAYTGTVAGRR